MSARYRIRASEGWDLFHGQFVVERKTGWFTWEWISATDDPENFKTIVQEDMEIQREANRLKHERDTFKPIHAAAYWLARLGKPGEADLRITIDTKG